MDQLPRIESKISTIISINNLKKIDNFKIFNQNNLDAHIIFI